MLGQIQFARNEQSPLAQRPIMESFCRHGKTAQAGQLESALLERNKECATLRRERNEAQQKLQDRTKLGYLWGSPSDILEYTLQRGVSSKGADCRVRVTWELETKGPEP